MLEREAVEKIAVLARLDLSDAEIELFRKQLGAVLDHVRELDAVEGLGEASTVRHVPKDAVAFREDRPVPFSSPAALLKNAPQSEGTSYLIPPVLE